MILPLIAKATSFLSLGMSRPACDSSRRRPDSPSWQGGYHCYSENESAFQVTSSAVTTLNYIPKSLFAAVTRELP